MSDVGEGLMSFYTGRNFLFKPFSSTDYHLRSVDITTEFK